MNSENIIDQFFATTNQELIVTVKRLDKLIGKNHWLSVGTYKETLLKKSLRKVIPTNYSIDSGFIVAANKEGELIRSTQTDILIWDSANYSPLFRDDDFVIIPPEACRIMIEVKGSLTGNELKKSILNFDAMANFCFVPLLQKFNIKKYIFAYDLYRFSFPKGLFTTIINTYDKNSSISSEDRMELLGKWEWPNESSPWPLLCIDGIFVLNKGFIINSIRQFGRKAHFVFNSFSIEANKDSLVYSAFETEILSSLGSLSKGRQGLYYIDQAGLLSLRTQIRIMPSQPKNIMIYPKVKSDEIHKDINIENVF